MNERLFTPAFANMLVENGLNPDFVYEDIASRWTESTDLKRLIRALTGLSNEEIDLGLFSKERDVLAVKIETTIYTLISDWMREDGSAVLPTLTVKEISRSADMTADQIVSILTRYPVTFELDGTVFTSVVENPEFPEGRLTLSDSGRYNLSAQRISREARYLSRKPGRKQVQKAGLTNKRINAKIRSKASESSRIFFRPEEFDDRAINYSVMKDLEISEQDLITELPENTADLTGADDALAALDWFRTAGFGTNWIYKKRESLFLENLLTLSRGGPADFLIWNCIGFQWFTDPKGGMPTCEITNNLDASITGYFRERIADVSYLLSAIGYPDIVILVPSNEGLDTNGVWRYRQSKETRRRILNETVSGLREIFNPRTIPNVSVMLWEEYLQSRGLTDTPDVFSREGVMRLRQSSSYDKIIREAVRSGRGYFTQNGITNIADSVLREREILYYGVYAGEGVAYEKIQQTGRSVTVVNFEEFRVPQMEYLGAHGNLAIATPITENEMLSYYRWEARQISKRTQ